MVKRIRDLFMIPPGIPEFLVWALASFHAATLIFVIVFYLNFTGGLRGFFSDGRDSGTVIGLVAFAVLWIASFAGTARALSQPATGRLDTQQVLTLIGSGSLGGAVSGVMFLVIGAAIAALFFSVGVVVEGNPQYVPAVIGASAGVAVIGGFFAAIAGGLLGIFAGVVDTILLKLAVATVGPLPRPHAPDAETPAT